jgi:outer membrane protein, multidrug efflux system
MTPVPLQSLGKFAQRAKTFKDSCISVLTVHMTHLHWFIVVLALLSGCAVGPNYRRPPALSSQPLPPAFSPVTDTWKPAEPAAHLPRDAWWNLFGDPELNRLESLSISENQDLAAAYARFSQARALVNVARSDFFPHLTASGSFTRLRTSKNAPVEGQPSEQSHTYDTFTVPIEIGWELDLWGRVRRQTEAARARLAASADDVESAKLLLQTEVASDYFTLRALDAERALIADTIETYRRSLELTVNRRKGGIATDLDVAQAETQLRTTEAQLPALTLERTKLLHALATLSGQPATGFEVAPSAERGSAGRSTLAASDASGLSKESAASEAAADHRPAPLSVPELPLLLPSELLERRPDIAAVERRMAAANADIGVAQSAFYPRIQLNGLAGYQSVSANTWFDWPSRMWAIGPLLELPLFTGGRNRAQLAAARAAYDETVARYRQTVLAAFQDVEDQLAAQRLLTSQLDSETAALAAARHTLEIANNRYRAGLVTYLEVATAQSAALARERAVAQLQGEKQVAAVSLIKALGGGWQGAAKELAMPTRR